MYWQDSGWSRLSSENESIRALIDSALGNKNIHDIREYRPPFLRDGVLLLRVELDNSVLSPWGGQYVRAWAFFLYEATAEKQLAAIDWTSGEQWVERWASRAQGQNERDAVEKLREFAKEYVRFHCAFRAPGAKQDNPNAIGSPLLICPIRILDQNIDERLDWACPRNTELRRAGEEITDIDGYIKQHFPLQSYETDEAKFSVRSFDAPQLTVEDRDKVHLDWSDRRFAPDEVDDPGDKGCLSVQKSSSDQSDQGVSTRRIEVREERKNTPSDIHLKGVDKSGRGSYRAPCIHQSAVLNTELTLDSSSGSVNMVTGKLVQSNAKAKRLEVRWHPDIKCFVLLEGCAPITVEAGLLRAALITKFSADEQRTFYKDEVESDKLSTDLYERLSGDRLFDITVVGDLELPSINWLFQLPTFECMQFLGNFSAPQAFFHHSLSFKNCGFVGRINLALSVVDGDLDFDGCVVRGIVLAGFGRKLRPAIDLYGAHVHGNVQLVLGEVDGVISANSLTVKGQVLFKGLLQRPRQHDAQRNRNYHAGWKLEGMVDFCHAKVENGRIDFSPAGKSALKHLLNGNDNIEIEYLRTQLAGELRLDYCVAEKVDLKGVFIGETYFFEKRGDERKVTQLTKSSCSMTNAQVHGLVDLNVHLHDEVNFRSGKAFRFQVGLFNARAIRAREVSMFGARIERAELVGAHISVALRGEAKGAYRPRIDKHLKLNGSEIRYIYFAGACIGRLKFNHANAGALILHGCPYWLGVVDAADGKDKPSTHGFFPLHIGNFKALQVPSPAGAREKLNKEDEGGAKNPVALEMQNSRFGNVSIGDAVVVGYCVIRSEITGDLLFWDKDGETRKEKYKERFENEFPKDLYEDPEIPVFDKSFVEIHGDLKLENSRIDRDLDITNIRIYSLEVPNLDASKEGCTRGGRMDLSDIQVGQDLKCRSYWKDKNTGEDVLLHAICNNLSLEMARVGGDCMLTGLKIGEKSEPRHAHPWMIFQRRLLGLSPPKFKSPKGFNLDASGLKVGGALELCTPTPRKYTILVKGALNLSFCEAKSVILCGDNFKTEFQSLNLANATVGCLTLRPGYPTYMNMSGVTVGEWEVNERDFLKILDATYPFDSGNYAYVEMDLRRSGDEMMADEVYRALCERERDEKLGEFLRGRRPEQTSEDVDEWPGSPDPEYRNAANLGSILKIRKNPKFELRRLYYEAGYFWGLFFVFLFPILMWAAIGKALSILAIPEPVWGLLALVFLILGLGHIGDGALRPGAFQIIPSRFLQKINSKLKDIYRYLARAAWLPVKSRDHFSREPQLPAWLNREKGMDSASYMFRIMRWVARITLRPFKGSWLLLMRLSTGHLTNRKPLILVILSTFLLGLTVFSVPHNFADESPDDPARGSWGRSSTVLTSIHVVVPLVNVFDVEEIYGERGFLALDDRPPTFFRFHSGWSFLDRLAIRLAEVWPGCAPTHHGEMEAEVLVACSHLQPTMVARVLSTVNWITWPLVLLGFASSLRQRKALQ